MNTDLLLGVSIMVLGVALLMVAVFRALGHTWTLGAYEMWAIPAAGVGLLLLGRWLIA